MNKQEIIEKIKELEEFYYNKYINYSEKGDKYNSSIYEERWFALFDLLLDIEE